MATATAGSATSTAIGARPSRRPCGRRMRPARSCSSTSPATRCRCSTPRPGTSGAPISSSRCWEHPTTPTQRRAGRKGLPTGSARTSTPSRARRRAEGGRLRQSQGRRHGGLPLRARDQPHLPGAGRPLRHGDPADASAQAARQGQGRSRGADRPALRAGAAAQPALLLAG